MKTGSRGGMLELSAGDRGRSRLAPLSPSVNLAWDVSWNNAVEPLPPGREPEKDSLFTFRVLRSAAEEVLWK